MEAWACARESQQLSNSLRLGVPGLSTGARVTEARRLSRANSNGVRLSRNDLEGVGDGKQAKEEHKELHRAAKRL